MPRAHTHAQAIAKTLAVLKAIYTTPEYRELDKLTTAAKEYPKRDCALEEMRYDEFYQLITRTQENVEPQESKNGQSVKENLVL